MPTTTDSDQSHRSPDAEKFSIIQELLVTAGIVFALTCLGLFIGQMLRFGFDQPIDYAVWTVIMTADMGWAPVLLVTGYILVRE